MNSGLKENANPIIHAVRKSGKPSRIFQEESYVGHAALRKYSKRVVSAASTYKSHICSDDDAIANQLSVEERSVWISLQDIYYRNSAAQEKQNKKVILSASEPATNGTSLQVLRDAGFYFDSHIQFTLPLFQQCFVEEKSHSKRVNHRDPFDEEEIFDMIRTINDPEHPLTLEQLNVVNVKDIQISNQTSGQHQPTVVIMFTPTIPHCSMATLIGLCLRVKLLRSLPSRFKVNVQIKPGSHASETAINKQLADKERVAAALENQHLLSVVNKCLSRLD